MASGEIILTEEEQESALQAQVNQRSLAFMVGLVAVGLPTVLIIAAYLLGECKWLSISQHYYSKFWGAVFVGALIFIGAFLFAFRSRYALDNWLATGAGVCAILVALLPASGAGCLAGEYDGRAFLTFNTIITEEAVQVKANGIDATFPIADHSVDRALTTVPDTHGISAFELYPGAGQHHFIAATLLFVILGIYALVVFRRVDPADLLDTNDPTSLNPNKRIRNSIYLVCGVTIFLSIVAIGLGIWVFDQQWWNAYRLTFVFEAVGLYAFGASWMVKGRFWMLNWLLDDEEISQMQRLEQARNPNAGTA